MPVPVGWLGCSGALLTNREAVSWLHISPFLLSARKSLSQLFDVFDRHPWKCWLYHVHSAPGPHSRVIRKLSRELGSLAWVLLVNMTAAASLGVMEKGWAGNPRHGMKEKKTMYNIAGLWLIPHITWQEYNYSCCVSKLPQENKKAMRVFLFF